MLCTLVWHAAQLAPRQMVTIDAKNLERRHSMSQAKNNTYLLIGNILRFSKKSNTNITFEFFVNISELLNEKQSQKILI